MITIGDVMPTSKPALWNYKIVGNLHPEQQTQVGPYYIGESLPESKRNSIRKAAIRHDLVSKEEHNLLVEVRRIETEFNSPIITIKRL